MSALQLVHAAAGGDEAAAALLYREHEPMVRGLIARRVRDAATVDDLCQEAWLRAFRGLGSFRGEAAFSTWMHTIVRNVLISWNRRKQPVPLPAEVLEETVAGRSDRVDLRMDLRRALEELPPGMREVLVLHDVEGWTHQQIADFIGVAEGTSKSQLFKARAKLRERLRDPAVEQLATH